MSAPDVLRRLLNNQRHVMISRRKVLWMLGGAAAGMRFASSAFGQGKRRDGYGTQTCPLSAEAATAPIKPVFTPTGWKTVALDHITFEMSDYQKRRSSWRLCDGSSEAMMVSRPC